MPALSHIYVTAHGEFTNAQWSAERFQFGVRLALAPVASAPAKGETFTPQANGEPTRVFGVQAGTNGTLTKTWTARVGAVGSLENFGPTEQIDVAEDVRTFLNAVKNYLYSGARWTHVKIAAIDATGHTVETAATYNFTTPIVGTAAGALPPQIAVAISMRANIVGRTGRGRIYLPAVGSGVLDPNINIDATAATAMRTAFKTLIDNLQNVTGFSTYLPIVCITSAGATTAVRPVEIRTGSRFDTIKSRREQAVEVYTSTAL